MIPEYLHSQLQNPSIIDSFYRYKWCFIDSFDFLIPAEKILPTNSNREILRKLTENFKKAGWEGDGIIYIMWLPPFLSENFDAAWGEYVWFVKQDNNGTCFLLSQNELDFPKLLEQQN